MVPTGVVDAELQALIDAVAASEQRSRSNVIRRGIGLYLHEGGYMQPGAFDTSNKVGHTNNESEDSGA